MARETTKKEKTGHTETQTEYLESVGAKNVQVIAMQIIGRVEHEKTCVRMGLKVLIDACQERLSENARNEIIGDINQAIEIFKGNPE